MTEEKQYLNTVQAGRLPQISGCRSAQPLRAGAFMNPRSRASMCAPSWYIRWVTVPSGLSAIMVSPGSL